MGLLMRNGIGYSGGGSESTFAGLDDVSLDNVQNGQVPKYNSQTQKWENANESGGGGDTVNVYGTFIDTNNIIQSSTAFQSTMSYTATEDCYITFYLVGNNNSIAQILIDNNWIVSNYYDGTYGNGIGFYLKKGQTISVSGTASNIDSAYMVYGIQQGSNTMIHYDDTERVVGTWFDVPLYQKTVETGGSIPAGATLIQRILQTGHDTLQYIKSQINLHYIEYIQNTSNAFIDTGVIPTVNTHFEITMSDVVGGNSETAIFGAGTYSSNSYLLTKDANSNVICWYYPSKVSATSAYTAKHTIELYRGTIKVDGNVIASGTSVGSTSFNKVTLFNVANSYSSKYKLYRFKMYEDTTLVFDAVPVLDTNDVACLYDLVSNRYIYSGNSSTFVAGPDAN